MCWDPVLFCSPITLPSALVQWVSVQTGGWVRVVEVWFCSVILLSEKFLPGVLTTGSSSLALPGPLQAKVYLGEGGG